MIDVNFDVSYYRTQWLMAHNRLHEIAHDCELADKVKTQWDGYLDDLKQAGQVATRSA